MQKKQSTQFEPAFPNVPMQTNVGGIILQPGMSKLEFITMQFYKTVLTNGKVSVSDDPEIQKAAMYKCRISAKLLIKEFENYAAAILEDQSKVVSLKS